MNAIVTGSFDPMTKGHVEYIKKASKCFEKIYVVALLNSDKETFFTTEEKRKIMQLSLQDDVPNAIVDVYGGMTADYMHKNNLKKIIRGIRDEKDLSYEKKLQIIMKTYDNEFETILVPSSPEYKNISSTKVKQCLKEGKSIEHLVAPNALAYILESYQNKQN